MWPHHSHSSFPVGLPGLHLGIDSSGIYPASSKSFPNWASQLPYVLLRAFHVALMVKNLPASASLARGSTNHTPWAKSGLLPMFANIVYSSTAMPFHLGIIYDAKNWLIGKDPDAGEDWR